MEEYISFKDREEWKDITPISQDDGPQPICPINYSTKFSETMGYFRAILVKQEMSTRALDLTEEVIDLNPANYTVWYFRRLLLKSVKFTINDEFKFCEQLALEEPKNYQIWYHRRAIVELSQDCSRELDFTTKAIQNDNKNYHAWAHRQWVIETFNLWEKELDFLESLLTFDIRNNSAWNHRFFILSRNKAITNEIRSLEIEYTINKIKLCASNVSAWNYLKGLMNGSNIDNYPTVIEFCDWMVQNHPICAPANVFKVDILQQKILQLKGKGQIEQLRELVNEAERICNNLATNLAVKHAKYWYYRIDQFQKQLQ
eukprot:TRINITY_DN2193_c0_g4_i1.p1 TRINITY_DN2193_c0_g4~~TRINITY_DN2193_c0_g4_i1.p1  ORF type:complete len:315 (-),score=112.61 TRINITY_DN2193_c0_g4_i1:73-1017(-)